MNLQYARAFCVFAGTLALVGCVQPDQPAMDTGTVLAVGPANMPGENSGAGGFLGAAAGGLVGSQIGAGVGKIATTIGGVVAGSMAGTAAETSLQSSTGLRYTVKLDRGYVLTIVQHRRDGDPILRPGTRVRIETDGHDQRVLPAL